MPQQLFLIAAADTVPAESDFAVERQVYAGRVFSGFSTSPVHSGRYMRDRTDRAIFQDLIVTGHGGIDRSAASALNAISWPAATGQAALQFSGDCGPGTVMFHKTLLGWVAIRRSHLGGERPHTLRSMRRRFVQRIVATATVAPAVFDDFIALEEPGHGVAK